jgi:hypothetical protein
VRFPDGQDLIGSDGFDNLPVSVRPADFEVGRRGSAQAEVQPRVV